MASLIRVELQDPDVGLHGFLVVDRRCEGIGVGGLRVAPGASLATTERLARLMSLKFGAMGIPLNGAKASLAASSRDPRLGRLLRRLGELLDPFLRTSVLLGEDLGTSAADVAELYTQLGIDPVDLALRGLPPGVRPPAEHRPEPGELFAHEFAGSLAGRGVATAALAAARARGLEPPRIRAAIQGFGTVGRAAARALAHAGITVVAVADVAGTVHARSGLDVGGLERAVDRWGLIDRERVAQRIDLLARDDWCRVDAELLVPAAVEDVITIAVVPDLNPAVKLVVEGANCPVSDEAEDALERKGVAVVPDFVASAGTAAAFGLLITGAVTRREDVLPEYLRRVEAATAAVLDGPLGGARRRGEALAARTFAGREA